MPTRRKRFRPVPRSPLQNWQKYQKFMQMWMQAAYSGKYKWHVGAEPEYTVEVGPTHHFPMYQKFIEDTEKYGGQAQLVPLPSGGFSWKNYVAGIPFPQSCRSRTLRPSSPTTPGPIFGRR